MTLKIISGGQDGADQAGLRAARRLGLVTGGWAPRGWKTAYGPAPWLAEYGLVESGWDYAGRTKANVRDADATVRFAKNFFSSGEKCTMKAIETFEKSYLDFRWIDGEFDVLVGCKGRQAQWALRDFLEKEHVKVLNVAGNGERTAPGIGKAVEEFISAALVGR